MYIKLILLFKDNTRKEYLVRTCWQDTMHGIQKLYYETMYDDDGKGTFIDTNELKCWKAVPHDIPGAKLNL